MPDVTTLVDRYIAAWNERDDDARRALVAQTWTEDGSYLDPARSGSGTDGLDAMIAEAQSHFPGHHIELTVPADAHNDVVRFTWTLLADDTAAPVVVGQDFGVIGTDGRFRAVTGFAQAPA